MILFSCANSKYRPQDRGTSHEKVKKMRVRDVAEDRHAALQNLRDELSYGESRNGNESTKDAKQHDRKASLAADEPAVRDQQPSIATLSLSCSPFFEFFVAS